MNFIGPQIAELQMCVSVAMVTRFTKQQNNTQSRIGPRNQCRQYELHRPSNSRVKNVCICCHGNKVYKATKEYTISYRPSNSRVREQSLKMLQTGVEEFKIFLWKISHPNIKFYFGFIPQQKNEKKVNTPTTTKKSLIIEACNNNQRNESSKLPE